VFFADEGSALAQAEQLADGDGWSRPLSFPRADPERTSFPLFNSVAGDRVVPLGQHPAYALAVEPWYALAGTTGAALLSIVALTVAAVLGACIGRRLRPGIEVPALWAIGVSSPLFLDGYLVVGHTIAAALAAAVALAVLRFSDGEQRAAMGAVAVGFAVGTGLVRNEGILYAVAVGVTLVAVGLRRRDRPVVALGALVAAGAEGSRFADALLRSHVVHLGSAQFGVAAEGSWIGSHAQSTFVTLFLPSYGKFDIGDVLLIIGVVCAIVAAVIARRRPEDRNGLFLFAGLAVGLVVVRLFFTPAPVPGILLAFPLLGIAAALANRRVLGRPNVGALATAMALYAGAVLLTQYAGAGGREWGWRYFSLALPVVVPLALIAIVDGAARISERDRRMAGRLLIALCAAIGVLAFLSLREVRHDDRQIVDGIRAAYQAAPAADGGKPVVVTTQAGTIDRFSWEHIDETRWLALDLKDRSQLAAYLNRIAKLGVGQVTFVTTHLDEDEPFIAGQGEIVDKRVFPDDHWVLTVRFRSGNI
jgi:lipoprotein signal peptidase